MRRCNALEHTNTRRRLRRRLLVVHLLAYRVDCEGGLNEERARSQTSASEKSSRVVHGGLTRGGEYVCVLPRSLLCVGLCECKHSFLLLLLAFPVQPNGSSSIAPQRNLPTAAITMK